jgi:hypothetical protein
MEPGSEVPFIPDLDDLALPLSANFGFNHNPVAPLAQALAAPASGPLHPLSSTSSTMTTTSTDHATFVGSSASSFVSRTTSKRKPLPADIPTMATMSTTISCTTEGKPQRDPDYYFSDGSCILQVENTLFNVCCISSGITHRMRISDIGQRHILKGA